MTIACDGRTGYRVIATIGDGPVMDSLVSWLPGAWMPAVAVVDATSGRLLRLTRYRGGKVASWPELRSVSDGGADDFGFTPPDEVRVAVEAVKRHLDEKVAVARGFLGSIFGGPRLVGEELLEGGGGLERDFLGEEVTARE